MNERYRLALTLVLGLSLAGYGRGDEPPKETAAFKGRVILDVNRNGRLDEGEKGIPAVLVTDGIQFVRTAADGSWSLKVAADPVIPYLPARVISVSWPTGTWPVGQHWYARLSDLKPGQSVDFFLREERQRLPFTIVHGTDPHNDFGDSHAFRDDVERMGGKVHCCVITGDLSYIGRESAKSFVSISKFTRAFPVPMLHTPGNHDIADIHTTRWSEQDDRAGYGLYTRYLGPLRWSFDYAGVHVVGLDWARITEDGKLQTGVPDVVIAWLKKDLGQLKSGTRIVLFMHHHYRHGDDRFWDVLVEHKVELLLAGHSHRNLDQTRRGIKALTTMNLCGPYRLLTVNEKGHAIVNRCFAGTETSHRHSYAGKCKMSEANLLKVQRGSHKEVVNREVKSAAHSIEGLQANNLEIIAEIEPGTAQKYGVRLVPADDKAQPLELACAGEELRCGDIATTAVNARGQKATHLRLILHEGVARVFASNRVQFDTAFAPGKPCRVDLFADGGNAVFRKVDFWQIEKKP